MDTNIRLNNNNINFSGIRLSNPKFDNVRGIAMGLKLRGYNVVGHRTFYINNNFDSKLKLFKFIREKNDFSANDFGFVFLPWSKEAYIVGSKKGEQNIMSNILKLDRKAHINLLF